MQKALLNTVTEALGYKVEEEASTSALQHKSSAKMAFRDFTFVHIIIILPIVPTPIIFPLLHMRAQGNYALIKCFLYSRLQVMYN